MTQQPSITARIHAKISAFKRKHGHNPRRLIVGTQTARAVKALVRSSLPTPSSDPLRDLIYDRATSYLIGLELVRCKRTRYLRVA